MRKYILSLLALLALSAGAQEKIRIDGERSYKVSDIDKIEVINVPKDEVPTTIVINVDAQQQDVPALQIQFKDGKRETLYNSNIRMYGLDNATAGDYVWARFNDTSKKNPWKLICIPSSYAWEGYDEMGLIISDCELSNDVEVPNESLSIPYYGVCRYFTYLKGKWVMPQGYLRIVTANSRIFEPNSDWYNENIELGKNYYCYGFYKEDGKTYLYNDEYYGTARIPKTMQSVADREKLDISLYADSYAVMVSTTEDAKQKFKERYGTESPYIEYALKDIKKDYAASLTEEQLQQLAYSTETCDDGKIYFISLSESCVERLQNETDAKGKETVYVQANLSSVLDKSDTRNSRNDFCTLVSGGTMEMRDCDASWGIKDNCYLTTVCATLGYGPQVALRVNRVMLPNVTYNITFSIAPQTVDTLPNNKPLSFMAYFADGANEKVIDESFPQVPGQGTANQNSVTRNCLLNPAVTEGTNKEKRTFEASSSEVTTFTVKYTPETFAYSHAFMVQNAFSYLSSANRQKYEQNIRLIGVEVTPAE